MFLKISIILISCLLLIAGGLLLLGYINMEKLLFPSPKAAECGNVKLKSGDALLDAVYLPPSPGKEVILYSHGNGETLSGMRCVPEIFADRGYGCLAYDYAGYGASGGIAGEMRSYSDIEAAYRFLTEEKQIPPEQIIVMGYSVGGGPSCYLAEKYPVKALVLLATFASATKVHFPTGLPFDRLENDKRVKNIKVPLMLCHGTADRTVPYRNSKRLAKRSASELIEFHRIPNGSHGDAVRFITGNPGILEAFLEKIDLQTQRPSE